MKQIKNKYRNRLIMGLLIILSAKIFGCSSISNSANSNNNAEIIKMRIKHGIPKVEEGWINHEKIDSSLFWSNPQKKMLTNAPHHFFKSSEIRKDGLIEDEDSFDYQISKDSISGYKLLMTTVFNESRIERQNYKMIFYLSEVTYPPTRSKYYTKLKADSILNAWGIDY